MGKDTDTPPPDPRLVDAQIKSLGIQGDAINRMMSMSEDLAPLQKQQLQQTIQQSADLWQQNLDDRKYMLDKRGQLSGVQDQIVNEASQYNVQQQGNKLAGQAMSDVNQQFANAREQSARDMQRMGVNPNDGRYAAIMAGGANQQALGLASAASNARNQAQQQKYALEDRASNTLSGFPAMSLQAQGQGVNTMGAGMQAINSGVSGMMAPTQAVSSAAGQMGSNATGAYGTQANAYAQSQQADASSMAGAGAAIGTIAVVI